MDPTTFRNSKKKVVVTSPYDQKAIFGPQGQRLIPTITQAMCGTSGLSACMVFMPPKRFARPHLHERTDIVVVVIEGLAASLIGGELEPVYHGPGEFIFIPEGVPHVAVNLSTTKRLIAIEMRTDPKFNEDVKPLAEYDTKAAAIVKDLQAKYTAGTLELPERLRGADVGPFRFADVSEADL